MKTINKILLLVGLFLIALNSYATTYYVNAKTGNNKDNGTSKEKAFKSLGKVNRLSLAAGDVVLFANGLTYEGTLTLENIRGDKNNFIEIGSYSDPKMPSTVLPVIDAKGYNNGILINNSSYVSVHDLTITADAGGVPKKISKKSMRCGVLITTSKKGEYSNIELENLEVRDVFLMNKSFERGAKESFTANGTQGYGWGIRLINATNGATIKDVIVRGCNVTNVAHTGIKFNGKKQNVQNILVENNTVYKTGGPGMQFGGVLNAEIRNNIINYSGDNGDSRKWGRGSGLWTWGCTNFVIEHNEFRNAKGPADSAGCHIDFNCTNVIVQYNLSENNAGGFCEILGNNFNCAYRYNISINDGHRVKEKGVASQEGKTFWLSGFNGKDRVRKGPYNSYFYNNTIYVKDDIQAKVAVDRASKGIFIANNIFYIEGASKQVLGDQYKPEVAGESSVENIVFKNNLFLRQNNWPEKTPIKDEAPCFGDPQFKNISGTTLQDFVPQNERLVKDKGIEITAIPGDSEGLFLGLSAEKDILGNPIKGKPDMGAIEMK
ncbi:right-handed parallel beta-helix repeat-containing protein [Flammeovirga pectinis]|uniref:Right-handed parallel beta-helix repeat-containing protein n=1 Tax=Flammeovirga pectinis TaxID=2494373 RepID=A0A3Q9FUE4_9BACT|nr:right-handed parallel beta-helix repeat-containing protein [Flammeovirga pectinis]AZQ64800.1 right-handed parallel beta-helix repeat-containing protein [Flammeovirga pectinis]